MEVILSLLNGALFIALIVGLVKPALILRWTNKPTRLKVIGYFIIASLPLFGVDFYLASKALQEENEKQAIELKKKKDTNKDGTVSEEEELQYREEQKKLREEEEKKELREKENKLRAEENKCNYADEQFIRRIMKEMNRDVTSFQIAGYRQYYVTYLAWSSSGKSSRGDKLYDYSNLDDCK